MLLLWQRCIFKGSVLSFFVYNSPINLLNHHSNRKLHIFPFGDYNCRTSTVGLTRKMKRKNSKKEGEREAPTDDLSEPYNVEKLNERKKRPTYCKSSLRGPSLVLFLCLSLSLSYMQAPVLAALENVRPWTGRGWRAVGVGGVGGGLGGGRWGWGGRTTFLRFSDTIFV